MLWKKATEANADTPTKVYRMKVNRSPPAVLRRLQNFFSAVSANGESAVPPVASSAWSGDVFIFFCYATPWLRSVDFQFISTVTVTKCQFARLSFTVLRRRRLCTAASRDASNKRRSRNVFVKTHHSARRQQQTRNKSVHIINVHYRREWILNITTAFFDRVAGWSRYLTVTRSWSQMSYKLHCL